MAAVSAYCPVLLALPCLRLPCAVQAIVPAITMLGLFLARLETPTKRLVLSVLIIALGTLLTSVGEVNFSLVGVVIVVLAISADVTRLVMTQMLLVGLKFHPGAR